jgi:hypothetical protein
MDDLIYSFERTLASFKAPLPEELDLDGHDEYEYTQLPLRRLFAFCLSPTLVRDVLDVL